MSKLLDECQDKTRLQVVVRWAAADIVSGVTDIEIFEDLQAQGIELYRHPSIHLKMLVFNRNLAFHTSGNFTNKGLGIHSEPNIEVGAQIRLTTKDWLELQRLLANATRIIPEEYELSCSYRDRYKSAGTPLPPLELRTSVSGEFSRLSLPAMESPEEFFQLYSWDEAQRMADDRFGSFVHDMALYCLDDDLTRSSLSANLGFRFREHPFTLALADFVRREGSARFGAVNAWITEHCSDKPTPYKWEMKEVTKRLYTWLDYFYEEITWDRPSYSQVIYWNRRE